VVRLGPSRLLLLPDPTPAYAEAQPGYVHGTASDPILFCVDAPEPSRIDHPTQTRNGQELADQKSRTLVTCKGERSRCWRQEFKVQGGGEMDTGGR
jgi:hypothetical protein